MANWQIVFFIAAGVYIFCATFYNVFGSGVRQEWDNPLLDADQQQQNGTNGVSYINSSDNLPVNGVTIVRETRQ